MGQSRRPQGDQDFQRPQPPKRSLPDRPVPFRPAMKVEPPKQVSPAPQPKRKPDDSLLKKVISAMEKQRPWVPGQKPAKPNPVADLNSDKKSIEDIRRQKSDEAQNKPNESILLDEDRGEINLSNDK